jgi:signal transduction histidine kinase
MPEEGSGRVIGSARTGLQAGEVSIDMSWLPRGRGLSEPDFEARHRLITVILALHVPGIVAYTMATGHTFDAGLLNALPVTVLLLGAMIPGARLRRSLAASLGLLTSSAVLVHISGGLIELHFHYFVAVAIVALYQEWLVYLTAILFVLIEHGVLGEIDHTTVYAHEGNAWLLAGVHAGFICAMAAAQLGFWHYQERARANEEHYRRELYDGQQSLVARLEDTARVRADLVGTVTHEFRTPLTGISGALLTLRRRRHRLDDAKIDDLLDAAMLHADRLRRMLENMLTAAEATSIDPNAEADVAAGIRDSVSVLPPQQQERVVLYLPDELPAQIGREALSQVLSNLLSNALTHSWAGTPVHLSAGRVGSDVVVRFRNSGTQLDESTIARLLEPFTQVDGSVTRTREGVGLGLYVVRRLVEVHGGQLTLQSADGVVTAEINLRAALVPDTPAGLADQVALPRSAPQIGAPQIGAPHISSAVEAG